tara:strand:+ start:249 stop:758 length:510 start_codon:yes stop_codon:yes gene_type:complete
MIENPFDAPIPGQSLTDTPGNAKWEHPPQFTDLYEASEYVWELMHDEKQLDQIISFLDNDVPVEAVSRMVLFGGFMEGKWSPDLALLLSEIVFKQILAIGVSANVKNMKLFIKDQSNAKFHKRFANFKITKDKAKTRSTSNDKIKNVVKEIETELEEKNSSGLMAKEND